MSNIVFSEIYIKLLGLLSKNYMRADKRDVMQIFKHEDNTCITVMGMQGMVHIRAPHDHAYLPDNIDTLNIANISQFVKLCKVSGYPKSSATLMVNQEVTSKGRQYEMITFSKEKTCYRTITAGDGEFELKYDQKIPTFSDTDALKLVAKISFSVETLKAIAEARSVIGNDAQNFCLIIENNEAFIYMIGSLRQQVKYAFNDMSYMIYGDFETKPGADGQFKLFSLQFFDSMQSFAQDFECEVRVHEMGGNQTVILKSYAQYGPDDKEKIKILVGCQESEAAVVSNNFDIII